jgi:hypothetical protein
VDASAVKVFDSAALAVLLACRRAAQAAGKQLVVGLPRACSPWRRCMAWTAAERRCASSIWSSLRSCRR